MNEKQVRNIFERLYEANSRLTAIAVRRAIRKDINASDVQNLAQLEFIQTDYLKEVLIERFEKNGLRYGNYFYNTMEEEKRFNPVFSAAWSRYVINEYGAKIGTKMKLLRGTIADQVSKEVLKNIESGADIVTDLTTEIEKVVNSQSFYRWQAERIARTETTTAMNTATQVAAEATGLDYQKQWLSASDGNERPSHAILNGETVEKDETFSNGLKYAGDPNGPASEVINCRCTILNIPINSAATNPVIEDRPQVIAPATPTPPILPRLSRNTT